MGGWSPSKVLGTRRTEQKFYLNYVFALTARDMARFGHLYLCNGRWHDQQVIPADWVRRSTTSYSDFEAAQAPASDEAGYGLLWWTHAWGYSAKGHGGHVIDVIPAKDLVIVHRVAHAPPREDVVSYGDVAAMVRLVVDAAPVR